MGNFIVDLCGNHDILVARIANVYMQIDRLIVIPI
jgi:hypothetical protein